MFIYMRIRNSRAGRYLGDTFGMSLLSAGTGTDTLRIAVVSLCRPARSRFVRVPFPVRIDPGRGRRTNIHKCAAYTLITVVFAAAGFYTYEMYAPKVNAGLSFPCENIITVN